MNYSFIIFNYAINLLFEFTLSKNEEDLNKVNNLILNINNKL